MQCRVDASRFTAHHSRVCIEMWQFTQIETILDEIKYIHHL